MEDVSGFLLSMLTGISGFIFGWLLRGNFTGRVSCSGMYEKWCAIHGSCQCKPDSKDNCPLHSSWSQHGQQEVSK